MPAASLSRTRRHFGRRLWPRLPALSTTVREAAVALAEDLGCPSCTHYEDLLEYGPVDAVLICTPPSTHAEIALHFLRQGIPVLCEKPVATKLEDACAMIEARTRQ